MNFSTLLRYIYITSFDSSSVSKKCSFCGSEYFIEVPETQEQKKTKINAEIILFKV
jgi:hypothetical protein